MTEIIVVFTGIVVATVAAIVIYRKSSRDNEKSTFSNQLSDEQKELAERIKSYSGSSRLTRDDINNYIEHSAAQSFLQMPGWDEWDESVHHSAGQLDRIRRSTEMSDCVIAYDNISHYAKIAGTGRTYLVSSHSCSCPDFRTRRLPCKHMYYLASELDGDSDKLIPDNNHKPLYGLHIALAGRFHGSMNGADGIRARINKAGGIWQNSMDKETDLLLVGSAPSESKLQYAKNNSIEIVDTDKLFSLFF